MNHENKKRLGTGAAFVACAGLVAGGAFVMTNGLSTRHVASGHPSDQAVNASVQNQDDLAANRALAVGAKDPSSAPSYASVAAQSSGTTPDMPDDDSTATLTNSNSATPTPATLAANKRYAAYLKSSHPGVPRQKMAANRISIPSVGVYASVAAVGVSGKYLTIPQQNWRTGWYNKSASLEAATGNTVIAGHVSYNGVPGVFYNLHKVKTGTVIYVSDSHGTVHAYRVVSDKLYGKKALPSSVFYPVAKRSLTLITCGGREGTVSGPNGTYYGHLDNEVVQAVPVSMR